MKITWIAAGLAVASVAACTQADQTRADSAAGALGDRIDSATTDLRREYSDAELAGLLNAVNDAEIEMGNMVASKATDPEVRAFAQQIARDHQALKRDVNALASKLNIRPIVPVADEDLPENHRRAMADLTAKPAGAEFDEAFVEHEIAVHREALDEVQDALNRNPNPDLRALLEQARTGLEAHLTQARNLERKFGA